MEDHIYKEILFNLIAGGIITPIKGVTYEDRHFCGFISSDDKTAVAIPYRDYETIRLEYIKFMEGKNTKRETVEIFGEKEEYKA